MKLKTNFKKIIAAFILIMIISSAFIGNFNSVYGRVNEYYSMDDVTASIDVSQATEDTTVLDAVARFIYAIAGFIESIVAKLVGIFTGSEVFPWADKVIFNTIEFLDVNFLSPSNGSMFRSINGRTTIFGNIIGNIYYTVFTLAVAFFGVVVGIMALRLAISSIASEKAKYKQAITNWLLALILIFTAHYLISFIFFVNEKMVEVASSILTTTSEKQSLNINIDTSSFDVDTKAHIFKQVMVGAGTSAAGGSIPLDVTDAGVLYGLFVRYDSDNGFLIAPVAIDLNNLANPMEAYTFGKPMDKEVTKKFVDNFMNLVFSKEYMKERDAIKDYQLEADEAIVAMLGEDRTFQSEDIWNTLFNSVIDIGSIFDKIKDIIDFIDKGKKNDITRIFSDALAITYSDSAIMNDVANNIKNNINSSANLKTSTSEEYITSYYNYMVKNDVTDGKRNYPSNLKNIFLNISVSTGSGTSGNVFTGLGQFFKNSVYGYTYDNNGNLIGFTATKFNAIPAILYSIFVIQSIMYFIAYMKRFFYIIVLALFAPIVIVYDFLMKTSMG